MAGTSSYPETIDNPTEKQDGIDIIQADDVNDAYAMANTTQTFIGETGKAASWSTDILDRLLNERTPIVQYSSDTAIIVTPGSILCANAGGSVRTLRRNTSNVTVNASNLDTGSMADATYYYVYAVADASGTTFTVKISASASAPTGVTHFKLLGWFYNQAAGSFSVTGKFIGNYKNRGRDVMNACSVKASTDINTTSSSLTDMTNMTIYFVSSGRRVEIILTAPISHSDADKPHLAIDVDGSTVAESTNLMPGSSGNPEVMTCVYQGELTAGTHTIKGRWHRGSTGTVYHQGATLTCDRVLAIKEL